MWCVILRSLDCFMLSSFHTGAYFSYRWWIFGTMWYTLGHTHLLASDQIHSLCWNIWCVILRYLDRFMLSSFHTWAKPPSRMFWHQDLTFYLWLLLLIDYGAIDTLGLVFTAYLDDLGYLPTFHFVLRHFTLDPFMLSILLELDHYLFFYPTHLTMTHDLIPLSRLGEDVDQSSISLVLL